MAEFVGGGLALATVALIAVSSAHIARPQALLPATPLHYASTSIEPSEEVAKLSLNEQPVGREDAAKVEQSETEAGSARRSTEAGSAGRSTDATASSPEMRPDPVYTPPPDTSAPARLRAAPTFVGDWSDDLRRCRAERKTPLVISSHAAKTANGECDFGFVARVAANRWRVAAICTSEGQFWRANIALKLVEPNLTWSSERGTETYVRCKH